MPSILPKEQAAAQKNHLDHGILLILGLILALLSPHQAVAGEQNLPTRETEQPTTLPDSPPSLDSPSSFPRQNNQGDFSQSSAASSEAFGTKGQKHWYVQGAVATTLDREEAFPQRFVLGGAGLSKFLFDGHSINLELNTIYFSQPDEDALGLNLALLMRWHFLRQSNWSMYVDGGAGVMGTTSDVPSKGASFNFTPQAGAGVSIKLKEQRRLMLGLRWHHVSHADLFGANPGRDSLMGYVGVQFPR